MAFWSRKVEYCRYIIVSRWVEWFCVVIIFKLVLWGFIEIKTTRNNEIIQVILPQTLLFLTHRYPSIYQRFKMDNTPDLTKDGRLYYA